MNDLDYMPIFAIDKFEISNYENIADMLHSYCINDGRM